MSVTLFFLLLMAQREIDVAGTPDQRVQQAAMIAPGQAPALSFRYYEGKLHHRFGNAELLLDDAGH
ncbi:MAG TPA: hypothetical protein VKX25_19155 [Bryobacteraceae bacterium]|nr:hypothetical protein [Bryobacteraceae bacterium]